MDSNSYFEKPNIYEEDNPSVVLNEHDFSNIVPIVEHVSYLVKYIDYIYKQFIELMKNDEKNNEQFKEEYKNYLYKKYSTFFRVYIQYESYAKNIECENYDSFITAVNDGNLKNIIKLNIEMKLSFKRGRGSNLNLHEHSFNIIFKPYDIKFTRKSTHTDNEFNKVESEIMDILNKFTVQNTIFCTK